MENPNPIKTTDPGQYPDFFIPLNLADKTLHFTTLTELDKTGWELDLVHALALDGDPLEFDADPDITIQKIGKCSELDGLKFGLVSTAARIRNGGDAVPAKVNYTLTFTDENGNLVASFSKKSDETNPVTFYTKITLKMEQ